MVLGRGEAGSLVQLVYAVIQPIPGFMVLRPHSKPSYRVRESQDHLTSFSNLIIFCLNYIERVLLSATKNTNSSTLQGKNRT